MTHGCLKCLKYTMCVANFLCFMSGVAVLGFGVYMLMNFKLIELTPSLAKLNIASMLLISGIIISCVSFLGFLGALKENRCLLLTFFLMLFFLLLMQLTAACLLLLYEKDISEWVERDLNEGLKEAKGKNPGDFRSEWDLVQNTFDCCGVHNVSDWGGNVPESCCFKDCTGPPQTPEYRSMGCLDKLRYWFEDNFLSTGISVIFLCIIEVTGGKKSKPTWPCVEKVSAPINLTTGWVTLSSNNGNQVMVITWNEFLTVLECFETLSC